MSEPQQPEQPKPEPSWLQGVKEQLRKTGVEFDAVFREGREDAWNNLVPAFPGSQNYTREMGAPGTPTPGGVDREIEGREYGSPLTAGPAQDIEPAKTEDVGPETDGPEQTQHRGRSR
jgi:hypothetical protein